MLIVPVVLSGGSGTRLWPLSRLLFPKQFHCLLGEDSLLQQTCQRAAEAAGSDELVVVANAEHRFMLAEQLHAAGFADATILLEPAARNTAPAAALAAFLVLAKHPEAVLAIMPSDHLIEDRPGFTAAVQHAARWAERGRLVTFGVQPSCAETGYGYIERGKELQLDDDHRAYAVSRFVEKPDAATAAAWVEGGRHYWNSGIFVFRARDYLEELRHWRPSIYAACQRAVAGAGVDADFVRVDEPAFVTCPAESIDYAVMENTQRAVVVPFQSAWSDVGSWSGLAEVEQADVDGNVGRGDVLFADSRGTYVRSGGRLVVAVGVDDLIVVETDDALLVTRKGRDQLVKSVVADLRKLQRSEAQLHTKVYRPWGSYQNLDRGAGFQVKRLIIKPGASISLQLHHRRSEHWVIVSGEALVTRGDEHFTLQPNESTYIPKETVHKLENPGRADLEVVEVQTGDYLEEDDIERFEDQYGRV